MSPKLSGRRNRQASLLDSLRGLPGPDYGKRGDHDNNTRTPRRVRGKSVARLARAIHPRRVYSRAVNPRDDDRGHGGGLNLPVVGRKPTDRRQPRWNGRARCLDEKHHRPTALRTKAPDRLDSDRKGEPCDTTRVTGSRHDTRSTGINNLALDDVILPKTRGQHSADAETSAGVTRSPTGATPDGRRTRSRRPSSEDESIIDHENLTAPVARRRSAYPTRAKTGTGANGGGPGRFVDKTPVPGFAEDCDHGRSSAGGRLEKHGGRAPSS